LFGALPNHPQKKGDVPGEEEEGVVWVNFSRPGQSPLKVDPTKAGERGWSKNYGGPQQAGRGKSSEKN